jgi:predicted Zn-dependent peptidase
MTRVSLSLAGMALSCLSACHPPIETIAPDEVANEPASTEPTLAQILAASDLPPIVPVPLDGDAMGVTVHRLDNGLTVYISTDRQKPRLDAWIAVRTGSRNDPASSTGLAHYLEHMLFKGTDEYGTLDLAAERAHIEAIERLYAELRDADEARRVAIFAEIDQHTQATASYAIPNEFDRMYAKLGIEGVNAFTSDEITAYIADVPANRFEAWAQVEGERFADPVFRLFYPELEAVYEEKNLSIDSPSDRVWETLLLALFPTHPYGTQPTIGVTEHLKSPAYADMVEYFGDWYVPNNMAVVLAGDIDAERALPVLEATLGRWQPRMLEAPAAASLEPIRGRVVREVVAEAEQTVTMAWRTVPIRHEDEPALEVLDWLTDNSRSGLLNVELELTQQVQDAGSWVTSLNEAGYFGLRATLQQG